AAFIAAALLELQDAPVDECNLFHGEVGGFGLFNEHGVPLKSYHALRLFRGLLDHPRRVEARGAEPGRLAVGAGLAEDGRSAAVLVSGFRPTGEELRLELKGLPWPGATVYDLQLLDTAHHPVTTGKGAALEREGSIPLRLRAPAVALVTLRPAAVGGR
ncbi:MAG TPA: hypothetical protein VK689_14390, partial [Armatimonadota bacterium]|nr:hypothetical protein [Armatimonadota bacterium]